ncbi:MAG: aminotransferase [Fibrobacteres bacterium]|nr:aminotransferase [Fibrobacterota bacterium]
MSPIYLDNHATTQVDPRVLSKMLPFFCEAFGNSSSQDHIYGDQASAAVEEARFEAAKLVNVDHRRLYFTSGATEAINIGIKGLALDRKNARGKIRIAVAPIEHHAVLETCKELYSLGTADIESIQIDSQGRIDLDQVQALCESNIDLLCIMAANNEVGNLYPVSEICNIATKNGVPVFCDASQAVGKIPFDFSALGISMAVFSGHKMYGPKGVGALFVSSDIKLYPVLHGGGQERGMRPGSLNVPCIVGLGEACRLQGFEMESDDRRIRALRDSLQRFFQNEIDDVVINGDENYRLAGNLNVSFIGVPNSAVISRVRNALAISTGSACSAGVDAPSHVLSAMRLEADVIEGALRFGIGKFNTGEELTNAARIVSDAVKEIRRIVRSGF